MKAIAFGLGALTWSSFNLQAQLQTESWGWTYQTNGNIYSSPAVDSNGNIYFGSGDNKLYALENNGSLKWTFDEATDWIDSSPAIGDDGTVYVGSWDNKLYAIDSADGTSKWSFETGSAVTASPAIGADGTIYFGSSDYFFYALESNGSQKWSYFVGDEINSSPAIGEDGSIYFGANDGDFYAIDENGTLKWTYTVPDTVADTNNTILSSPALDISGKIYFGCKNGFLYSLTDNGSSASLNWSFETTDAIDSSPVFGPEGNLYFISRDGYLRALDSSGGVEYWSAAVGDVFYSTPAVDTQGNVYLVAYVGGGSNVAAVYESNGTLSWTSTSASITVGGVVDSSLTLTSNGYLLFGSFDDKLYSINMGYGLAESDWPKFHRNLAADGSWPSYYVDSNASPAAGGTVTGGGTYNQGASVTLTANAATGYDFTSWSGDANGNSASYTFATLAGNKAATANFTLRQYALGLSAGTGGSVSGAGTYDHGTTVSITATPSTGYDFSGWTGASVTDSTAANTTITLTEVQNLTANFVLKEYTLTVSSGTGGSASGEGNFTHGTTTSITANPSAGYHFVNWSGESVTDANAASTTIIMDQNRSVTANFAIDEHVLTLNAGTGGNVSGAGTFDYGTNASIAASPSTGYSFDYWTGAGVSSTSSANTTVAMTADRNVSAVFALNQYILSVTAGSGGSVLGAGTYAHGADASISASPETGYHFVNWSGDTVANANSAATTITMEQNNSVTANFAIDEHVLTLNTGSGGSVSGAGTFNYGTDASITATPEAGYQFVAWTGAGATDSTAATTTVSMTSDRNVTASFAIIQYTLSADANGSGSVSGAGTYDHGTVASITATADTGHHFVNWTGDTVANANAASTTITLTADSKVTANFEADTHQLVVNAGSNGSVSGDGNYSYGTNASITATANSGFYFTGWTGDGVADANSSSTTVSMTEDRNVTASFAQVPINEYVLQTFANPEGSGSTSGGGTYTENSSVTLTATAASGHQFLGWSASGGTLGSPLSATAATVTLDQSSDINATAHFATLNQRLEFNATAGGTTTGEGNYTLGESVSISATADTGYTFTGWETNGTMDFLVTTAARQYDGSANAYYLDGRESPPLTLVRGMVYQFILDGTTTANHPFYFSTDAADGGNSYTGEYTTGVTNSRAASGTVSIVVDTNTPSTLYYYCGHHSGMGQTISVIDATGLLTDASASSATATASGSYQIRANFTLNQHTLTVNAGANGSASGSGTFDYGTNATITATPSSGFIFSSWSGSGVADANLSATTISMTEDRNVTANFETGSYTLVVSGSPSEGGSVIGGGSFSHGETANIAATPANGYLFSGWSGSNLTDASSSSTTVTVISSQTITANFQPATVTLALFSNPTNAGTLTGAGTFDFDTNASISATASTGYVFTGWSGSGIAESNSSSTTVSLTEDRNVTANFEIASHTLTVATQAEGGGTVSGGGTFSHGNTASITATPQTGYVFSGWSGSGITDVTASSTTVEVNASQTVTASFAAASYSVTVQGDQANAGTFSGAGTYLHGTTAELNATAAHGYAFSHWSGLFLTDYNSTSISLTITENVDLTAHFVAHSDSGELHYELNATELEAGWKESNWFGFFHQADDNWAYHYDFGWIYVDQVADGGFWYWDDMMDWLWTNDQVYPSAWSKEKNNWIRFAQDTDTGILQTNPNGRLWYYDYSGDQWAGALPSYQVTATSSASEKGSVSGGGTFLEGETATLTATAASGYEFTGWSGDSSSTSAVLSITVNSALTVTANFSAITGTGNGSTTEETLESIFGR